MNYDYAYTDHLGSITGWSDAAGVYLSNSIALHEPFGAYRFRPPASVNPGISDRGFTGHRMNNSATNDLGLIYMNARYYLPEIGRFISADTIVPEPKNPQTYNRYSYALNSPVNFTDPTGHCTSNYEAGSQDLQTCLDGWNAVVNYLYGAAFGPGGSGNFPNETVSDWLANADIGTLENLMQSYGIDYGYAYAPPQGYSGRAPTGAEDLRGPVARAEVCYYWQGCYQPATDYTSISFRVYGPIGGKVIRDDFGNLYLGVQFSIMPGIGIYRGDANIAHSNGTTDVAELAVDLREAALQDALTGIGSGGSAAWYLGGSVSGNPRGDRFYEAGAATRGISADITYMWLVYNAGSSSPWIWQ